MLACIRKACPTAILEWAVLDPTLVNQVWLTGCRCILEHQAQMDLSVRQAR